MSADQLAAILARQEELHQRLIAAEAAATQAQQRATSAERRLESERGDRAARTPLVDTRTLGKPKVFSGKREEWQAWQFGFTAYLGGADPGVLAALQWAERNADAIPNVAPTGSEHEQHARYTRQLFLALSLQVADNSEAMVKLMNIADQNGLEAWRVLKRHYEPMTLGNMRLRMDKLLRPKAPERMDQILAAIEGWEKEVREYEMRYSKSVDADVKIATLVYMAPEAVKRHVYLNEHLFRDYGVTRKLISDYLDQHTVETHLSGAAVPESVPMEIGSIEQRVLALEKGKKGKGKNSKGKDYKGKSGKAQTKDKQPYTGKDKGSKRKGKGKEDQAQGKGAGDGKIQGY
eukprot:4034035-Amphidinium_carterae.1